MTENGRKHAEMDRQLSPGFTGNIRDGGNTAQFGLNPAANCEKTEKKPLKGCSSWGSSPVGSSSQESPELFVKTPTVTDGLKGVKPQWIKVYNAHP